ncbi:MAG: hypothetical protein M0Q42_03065 [Xanthomonadales bacterium]|nr:hypothetical protein [Xanthomonadales bacterium]
MSYPQPSRCLSCALLSTVLVLGAASAHAAGSGSARIDLSDSSSVAPLPTDPPIQPGERGSTLQFIYDDGSIESAHGVFRIPQYDRSVAGVYLNRFPVGHPLKVDSISIFWPPPVANVAPGLELMLVAYYDADIDGNPANAVRLGSDVHVTVGAQGEWSTYPVDFDVPAAGDLYVGFVNLWARVPNGVALPLQYPGSADSDNPHCQSYMAYQSNPLMLVDYDDIGANAVIEVLHDPDTMGVEDFMIRATGQALPGDDLFTNGFDNLIACTISG